MIPCVNELPLGNISLNVLPLLSKDTLNTLPPIEVQYNVCADSTITDPSLISFCMSSLSVT